MSGKFFAMVAGCTIVFGATSAFAKAYLPDSVTDEAVAEYRKVYVLFTKEESNLSSDDIKDALAKYCNWREAGFTEMEIRRAFIVKMLEADWNEKQRETGLNFYVSSAVAAERKVCTQHKTIR